MEWHLILFIQHNPRSLIMSTIVVCPFYKIQCIPYFAYTDCVLENLFNDNYYRWQEKVQRIDESIKKHGCHFILLCLHVLTNKQTWEHQISLNYILETKRWMLSLRWMFSKVVWILKCKCMVEFCCCCINYSILYYVIIYYCY